MLYGLGWRKMPNKITKNKSFRVLFIVRPIVAFIIFPFTTHPMDWIERAETEADAKKSLEICGVCNRKLSKKIAVLKDSESGKITHGTAIICRYSRGRFSMHTRKIYNSSGQEIDV